VAVGHSLFRQEAVEFQRGQGEFGDLALLQPVATKLLAWLLAAVVTVAVVFLCFAQFSRKQTVAGFLTPAGGTLKVFPNREGVVTNLYVKHGQQVKLGDPLFAVATPQIAADGEDLDAAKLAALRHQKDLIQAQIATEQKSAATEREHLSALIPGMQSSISDLRGQIELQTQRVQLAESLVAAAKELLGKGYMSELESRRREDLLLEQKQNLAALRRQMVELQNKLAETQFSLKELPTATARKVQPLRDQISEVEQRTAEGKGRTSYVVRAPGAGRVSMLQIAVGQTVQPQRLQIEIVPDDSPLQAELFIPTHAAGFVRVGQEVRFQYDAFPYQNFGTYTGRVVELSQTVLTRSDATGPVIPEEPVYKAAAALDRADIDANGQQAPLQAGMLLKAEIILDRRSLANWILDPLLHKRM
jgi:membrane fusion protein